MYFIRRDANATYKLKTRYRYFIRLSKTDKTSKDEFNLPDEFNSF